MLKRKWAIGIVVVLTASALVGCESIGRRVKDISSSVVGINRVATVYDQQGGVIKTYKGKFDVEVNQYGNKIKFDVDGKRILIYNATVIVEEE